jgi:Helicase associated domain
LVHRLFQVVSQQTALYDWVWEQRTEYEKYVEGKPSALCSDRIRKLNKGGFPWKASGRASNTNDLPKSWEKMYGELLAFLIHFPSFNVPPQMPLCTWMAAQRRMRHCHITALNKSALAKERIRKLDEIGFPWEAKAPSVAPRADMNAPSPPVTKEPVRAGVVAFTPQSTR